MASSIPTFSSMLSDSEIDYSQLHGTPYGTIDMNHHTGHFMNPGPNHQSDGRAPNIAHITREMLLAAGNSAYMRAVYDLEVLRNENTRLKAEIAKYQDQGAIVIQSLTKDVKEIVQESIKMTLPEAIQEEFIILPSGARIPKPKKLIPLAQSDYPNVPFWTLQKFRDSGKENAGKTDGLATQKPRRGRPRTSDGEEKHTYLTDANGKPLGRVRLGFIGDSARQVWGSLADFGLTYPTYKAIRGLAYEYYQGEMFSKYEEFRLCENAWKLDEWSMRNYSSWYRNEILTPDAGRVMHQMV
ncbi:hypothetical protein BD779DRAFT_1668112 [Infundibulicybe gibba]|nr:hypothetical protein BD779DRAFT_1668112 [Infundibulicybe gibba]